MRAICNVCKDKDTCSYIKNSKEGDCIDVQTSDYGYEEAVEKACKWLCEHVSVFGEAESDGWNATYIYDVEMLLKQFKQAMEE